MRPSAEFVKQRYLHALDIAEIGVYLGANAKDMLENIPQIETLHLIDPYEYNRGYDPTQECEVIDPVDARQKAFETLKPYGKHDWIYEISDDAVRHFVGHPLDYVYIDGDHRYERIAHDIKTWWPIVKHGGVLAGHDYHQQYRPDIHQGIDRAVDEFVEAYGLKRFWEEYDWWVIKP